MQKIPDTFCPAKWDELFINLDFGLTYACCKSVPISNKININQVDQTLNKEKQNLLNGIKDPSCEYCWKIEDNNHPSRRHNYLKYFNIEDLSKYNLNRQPSYVEISLGNECNFQCMYCNPKFSSKWYADILNKPYKLFNEKFNYELPEKNLIFKNDRVHLFKHYSESAHRMDFIGGEPFYNKQFIPILKEITCKEIMLTTNLSASKETLNKFFKISEKFEKVLFNFSIDATGSIAEFLRFGLNFNEFTDNLDYILKNAPDNHFFTCNSLMTSLSITDLRNLAEYMYRYLNTSTALRWEFAYCRQPQFQGFDTLRNELKEPALLVLNELANHPQLNTRINSVDSVISAINASKFNKTLYQQLVHFTKEFSERKRISIPFTL